MTSAEQDDVRLLSADELARLREEHARSCSGPDFIESCAYGCDEGWPCLIASLLATLDARDATISEFDAIHDPDADGPHCGCMELTVHAREDEIARLQVALEAARIEPHHLIEAIGCECRSDTCVASDADCDHFSAAHNAAIDAALGSQS